LPVATAAEFVLTLAAAQGLGLEAMVIVRIPIDEIRESHYAGLCCTVVLPDVLVPDGAQAERLEVYSAALLFSGGIKEMLVAIGKSTKRGQKKALFMMQTQAYDR
jgi:hypothetical protein